MGRGAEAERLGQGARSSGEGARGHGACDTVGEGSAPAIYRSSSPCRSCTSASHSLLPPFLFPNFARYYFLLSSRIWLFVGLYQIRWARWGRGAKLRERGLILYRICSNKTISCIIHKPGNGQRAFGLGVWTSAVEYEHDWLCL